MNSEVRTIIKSPGSIKLYKIFCGWREFHPSIAVMTIIPVQSLHPSQSLLIQKICRTKISLIMKFLVKFKYRFILIQTIVAESQMIQPDET